MAAHTRQRLVVGGKKARTAEKGWRATKRYVVVQKRGEDDGITPRKARMERKARIWPAQKGRSLPPSNTPTEEEGGLWGPARRVGGNAS